MVNDKYKLLYSSGCISLDRFLLHEFHLSDSLTSFLVSFGLPVSDDKDPFLGIVFQQPCLQQQKNQHFLVIATEEWSENLNIGIDILSERVYTFSNDEKAKLINSSLEQFLFYLDATAYFLKSCSLPDTPALTLTIDQSQKMLEDFRNGKIKPDIEKIQALQKCEQLFHVEFRKLKNVLRKNDTQALKRNSWWSNILEEIENGLI